MDEFRISDMKRHAPAGGQFRQSERYPPPSAPQYAAAPETIKGPVPRPAGEATQPLLEDINLRQYWETVLRHHMLVISITLAVFLVTIASTYFKPDKYKARAELLRKEGSADITSSSNNQVFLVETLIRIASSRPVLERAAALLPDALQQVADNGYEVPKADWDLARAVITQGLPGSVTAKPDSDSEDIFSIEVESQESRFMVAAIANAAARALIDRLADINQREALQKCTILEGLLEGKQTEIRGVENEILGLKRQQEESGETFTVIAADEKRLLDVVSEYEMLYQENKLQMEELQEQIKAIKHELDVEGVPMDQIQWVDMSNVMEQRLQELKVQRAELLTRYTKENPKIARIENQIRSMESIYKTAAPGGGEGKKRVTVDLLRSKMVTELVLKESALQGIVTKLGGIKKIRDDLNNKLIELPVRTLEIERLKRQKEILEKLSDDLRRDYQQEKIASTGRMAEVEIIEAAMPPDRPFYPNRVKLGLVGLVCALFLGVAAAFVFEHWDDTINTTGEIKRRLRVNPLGLIPLWSEEDKFIKPMGFDDINAEVYGVLRNNIRYSATENPEKCLLVASAIQGEGKSLTAVNLACSFALEGNRTLVVALDLRKRRNYFGLRRDEDADKKVQGISDLLAGEAGYEQIIHPTTFENLCVIPSGEIRKNAARLLNTQKLTRFLQDMQREFDVVILDAPAVLPVVDTTIIAPLVRGVLLVVGAGKTPNGACQQAISRLEHVKSYIIGAVLNKSKEIRYDFFYGAGYRYKGYGKNKDNNLYHA